MTSRQPQQVQINIEIPPDLDAVYSNLAIITHSASEVIIDFARILPNSPRARVYARVVTTPMHAKLLLRALSEVAPQNSVELPFLEGCGRIQAHFHNFLEVYQ